MIAEKKEWLNTSVFYTQENWDILLRQCVGPFLNELNSSMPSLVSLNKDRGDNVRLSVYATLSDFEALTQKLSSEIGAFIEANPSVRLPSEFPLSTFFLNVPNNTIRYDMYANLIFTEKSNKEENFKLRHFLSDCIFSELTNSTIDDETIFSFLLYLLLGAVRSYCPEIRQARQQLKSIMGKLEQSVIATTPQLNSMSGSEVVQQWNAIFEKNKEILMEICMDVWTEDPRPEALGWLNRWEKEVLTFVPADSHLEEILPIIWNMVSDHIGGYDSSQTLLPFVTLLYNALSLFDTSEIKSENNKFSVTAILTVWKRNNLEEQIQALLVQTFPVDKIIVYHCGDFITPDFSLKDKYPNLHYQYNTGDLGYFGRFSTGLTAKSTHLYILDDDVIPSSRWIEYCLQLCESKTAIIASAGRIIPPDNYMPENISRMDYLTSYFIGDSTPNLNVNLCDEDTVVDYGCNSWFLKTSWLRYFWSAKPQTLDTGEDIHLSASCYLESGIQTICPKQDLMTVNGNLKKNYGFDDYASWKQQDFLIKREAVLREWIDVAGWKPRLWT